MTFTEEQIEHIKLIMAPWMKATAIEAAIAELTRPQPEFRGFEVCWESDKGYRQYYHRESDKVRKLRLSELPEAVERLRNMVGDSLTLFAYDELEGLRKALANFDREIES